MSYTEKIIEFQLSAEQCLNNGQYNSAANRAYYSAFLLAKNQIMFEDDTYKSHKDVKEEIFKFLKSVNSKISKKDYSNFRIHYEEIKKNRIEADYFTKNTERKVAQSSLYSLKTIMRILNGKPEK